MRSRAATVIHFLWDFVVGDDWRIAGAIAAVLIIILLAGSGSHGPWWLLPVVVAAVLLLSVGNAARSRDRD